MNRFLKRFLIENKIDLINNNFDSLFSKYRDFWIENSPNGYVIYSNNTDDHLLNFLLKSFTLDDILSKMTNLYPFMFTFYDGTVYIPENIKEIKDKAFAYSKADIKFNSELGYWDHRGKFTLKIKVDPTAFHDFRGTVNIY